MTYDGTLTQKDMERFVIYAIEAFLGRMGQPLPTTRSKIAWEHKGRKLSWVICCGLGQSEGSHMLAGTGML